MKRLMAALTVALAAVLPAACDRTPKDEASETPSETAAPPHPAPAPADTVVPAPASAPAEPAPSGPAAAADAPAFAVLYPGATIEGPAVTASGPAGPGGMVTYTTEADPDAVIAFHRTRAEAAGLATSMAMNQGDARAYGAAKPAVGAVLQVVASPTEAGETSVQLSWSAGQ